MGPGGGRDSNPSRPELRGKDTRRVHCGKPAKPVCPLGGDSGISRKPVCKRLAESASRLCLSGPPRASRRTPPVRWLEGWEEGDSGRTSP